MKLMLTRQRSSQINNTDAMEALIDSKLSELKESLLKDFKTQLDEYIEGKKRR